MVEVLNFITEITKQNKTTHVNVINTNPLLPNYRVKKSS